MGCSGVPDVRSKPRMKNIETPWNTIKFGRCWLIFQIWGCLRWFGQPQQRGPLAGTWDPDNLNGQCDLFLKWIHHNGYIITSFPYFYGTITDRCLRVEDSLQFMAIVFFFPLNNSIFEDALQAAFSKKNWLAFRRYLARPPDSSARWGRWEGMTELDGA